MKIFKIKKNIDAGFVLLFAVTLASILLSIGLGISNIAFKELSFNISAKDSNSAFLASDTGAECALFNDKLTDSAFPLDGVGKRDISCAGQNIETNFSGTGNTANYDFNILNSSGGSVATCAKVNVFKDKTTNPTKVVVTSSGYNTNNCAKISEISENTNPHLVERQLVISSTVGIPPTYTSTAPSVTLTATPSSMSSGSSALLSWTTSNGTTRCNASGGSGSDGWLTSPSGTLKSWPNGTQSTGPLTSTQTYTLTCDNYMTPVQLVPFVSAQSSVTVQVTAPAPVCDTSFPNDIFRVCYFDGISAPTTAVAYLSQFNEPTTIASPVGTLSNAFTNDWGGGLVDSSGKSDSVSAVWRGNINFQAGNYVFHVVADDGVQLTVGGVNVINNAWVDQGQTQYNSASVSLSGYTNVQMRWYENGGGAYSKLWWDYTPASCPITGGSIADVGGYRIHTFTTSGAFTVGCAKTVDYLIVGGGGGGASVTDQTGGGGGGGEVVSGTSALSSGSSFPITSIGNGGTNGGSGGNTVAGGLTVRGGGGGGSGSNPVAGSGGSGAGAKSGHFGPYTGGASTRVSPGMGNAGGSGNDYGAGGGGGATAVGQTAWNNGTWHGGNGGAGYASSISGVATYYGAGGGGAGGNAYNGGTGGTGGSGGSGVGGAGANFTADPSCYRASGGVATGFGNGGGGAAHIGSYSGGCDDDLVAGGAGSPGVVIIRYAYP